MYLRSLVFDHDFDFANEYDRYDNIYGTDLVEQSITPIGRSGNPFAVGLSVLLTPFFILAFLFDHIFSLASVDLAGFGIVYQLFLSLGSIVFIIIGSVLLFKTLQKFFSSRSAWFSTILVVLVSPLLHYIIYEPTMSHGVSFFTVCLLFWLTIGFFYKEKINKKDLFWLGIGIGLSALVRWQNIIFALLPLFVCLQKIKEQKIKIKDLLLPVLIVFLILLPQFLIWKYLYGSFLLIPQGSSFIEPFKIHIWGVLFSGYHGLFSWHPFLLFGFLGLLLSLKKNKMIVWILLIMLFLQIYLNSSLLDWWGGSAFGARKMIGSLFIFAYGFGYLLDKVGKGKIKILLISCLVCLAVVWNYLLLVAAPRGFLSLNRQVSWSEIYSAPFKLLK